MRRFYWLAAVFLSLFLMVSGCVQKPPQKKGLHVLCTVLPMYAFTKNIVGSVPDVTVGLIIPASLGEPHDYTLTPGLKCVTPTSVQRQPSSTLAAT